jgi:hypothetical protein
VDLFCIAANVMPTINPENTAATTIIFKIYVRITALYRNLFVPECLDRV